MRHNNVDPMRVHKSIMHQIRLISPSTTNDTFPSSDFGHMLSVGSIYFEDIGIVLAKSGIVGGGWA